MPRKLNSSEPKPTPRRRISVETAVRASIHSAYTAPTISSALFAPSGNVAKAHVEVVQALNLLVTGKGVYRHWEVVMRRFFAGAIAIQDYMEPNFALNQLINDASDQLRTVWVRYVCTKEMGVLVTELDTFQELLSHIDAAFRVMRPKEIETAYHDADMWMARTAMLNARSEKLGKVQEKIAA